MESYIEQNGIPTTFEPNSYSNGKNVGFTVGFTNAWIDSGRSTDGDNGGGGDGETDPFNVGYNIGRTDGESYASTAQSNSEFYETLNSLELDGNEYYQAPDSNEPNYNSLKLRYDGVIYGFKRGWYNIRPQDRYPNGYQEGREQGLADAYLYVTGMTPGTTLEQALNEKSSQNYQYAQPDFELEDNPFDYGFYDGLIAGFTERFNELTA